MTSKNHNKLTLVFSKNLSGGHLDNSVKPDFHSGFSLVTSEVFARDIRRVVKPIKQDEKNLSLSLYLRFKYFNFCKCSYSETNQTSLIILCVTWAFYKDQKILQNDCPTALSGPREERPQYIPKTRIIELQTSFRL